MADRAAGRSAARRRAQTRKMPSPAAPATSRPGRTRSRLRMSPVQTSSSASIAKPDGEIAGRPVDGVVAGEQVGPGDPEPAGGEDGGDRASLPCPPRSHKASDREAERERQRYATARPRDCRARTGGNRCAARTAGSPTANRSTIRTSELLDMRDHARPHGRVGQPPGGGAHVLPHMIDAGRRRDGAGHGRMRDDELENELRPARAADLGGPAGQRMALRASGSARPRETAG